MPTQSPTAQLRGFLAKFAPEHATLIRAARAKLRKRWPGATELVYDNYNFFVIGYSPTARPSDSILSIVGGSNGVSLCFMHGKKLPDPAKRLHGEGKQTRFLRLDSAATLDEREVVALLEIAAARAKPMPASGGKLVIRSISAKQRPRRRDS